VTRGFPAVVRVVLLYPSIVASFDGYGNPRRQK